MRIDSFTGKYDFLSNFSKSVIYDTKGIEYPTVEHYFQAMKTFNTQKRQEIATAPTPGKAKRLGRHVFLRPDWNDVKIEVMREALEQKFSKPNLREKLLATGDAELIEGNWWHDNFYGDCRCEKCRNIIGENNLGKLLMEIREKIKNDSVG